MKDLIKKILKEEFEVKTSVKTKLQDLVDKLGIEKTKNAVGGLENLIKILYDGDLKRYYQENDIEPYWISFETYLYLDDLLVQTLDLPDVTKVSYTYENEKLLGDFRLTSQGIDYKFTARIFPRNYTNGRKWWMVVGTSSDNRGFGYSWITKKDTLGKKARLQIFKQIINKYNLNFYG